LPMQLYKREEILEACLSVFARHGYKKTSTVMLAEAAGISRSLIFYHFKSKKELYLSIVDWCFEKFGAEFGSDILLTYWDFFEAKEKFSVLRLDYMKRNPDLYKVAFEAFLATPDEVKADIEKKYGEVRTVRDKQWRELFDRVPLRKGVDREMAFELIKNTLDHFEKKALSELNIENDVDEAYWQSFLDKRNCFLNMIRYGIEQ